VQTVLLLLLYLLLLPPMLLLLSLHLLSLVQVSVRLCPRPYRFPLADLPMQGLISAPGPNFRTRFFRVFPYVI